MRKCLVPVLLLLLWGCGKSTKVAAPLGIDEPDRVLYENALRQLERHDYPVARELLQTLISTYQDSDYFPKAKYALAESFYREGGKDFFVFTVPPDADHCDFTLKFSPKAKAVQFTDFRLLLEEGVPAG